MNTVKFVGWLKGKVSSFWVTRFLLEEGVYKCCSICKMSLTGGV